MRKRNRRSGRAGWKAASGRWPTSGSSPARQITFGEQGRLAAAVVARRQADQLRVVARQRRSQIADLPDARRRRRSVEADRRQGKRQRVFMVARRHAHRVRDAPIRAAPTKKPTSRNAMTSACSKATSAISTRGSLTSPRKTVDADHRRHVLHAAGRAVVVARRQALRVWRRRHADAARQPPRRLRRRRSTTSRSTRSAPTGAATRRRDGRRTAAPSRG